MKILHVLVCVSCLLVAGHRANGKLVRAWGDVKYPYYAHIPMETPAVSSSLPCDNFEVAYASVSIKPKKKLQSFATINLFDVVAKYFSSSYIIDSWRDDQ